MRFTIFWFMVLLLGMLLIAPERWMFAIPTAFLGSRLMHFFYYGDSTKSRTI